LPSRSSPKPWSRSLGSDRTRIFEDRGVSGAKADRRGLARALAYMRDGDTNVICKLDASVAR
jgi:hypothetical protein